LVFCDVDALVVVEGRDGRTAWRGSAEAAVVVEGREGGANMSVFFSFFGSIDSSAERLGDMETRAGVSG
jgi:hypothetical protein